MPKMVRFLLENAVTGVVAGWILLAYLLFSGVFGLGALVFHATNPVMPIVMLMIGFAITFGSASMGIAIMTLPYLKNGGGGKPSRIAAFFSHFIVDRQLVTQHAPVPVKVQD